MEAVKTLETKVKEYEEQRAAYKTQKHRMQRELNYFKQKKITLQGQINVKKEQFKPIKQSHKSLIRRVGAVIGAENRTAAGRDGDVEEVERTDRFPGRATSNCKRKLETDGASEPAKKKKNELSSEDAKRLKDTNYAKFLGDHNKYYLSNGTIAKQLKDHNIFSCSEN